MKILRLPIYLALALILMFDDCTPVNQPPASDDGLTAELVLDAKAQLGEGAFWHPDLQVLYWVDIEGKAVHVYDPATGKDQTHPVGQRVGNVVPAKNGSAVVALETGIYFLHLHSDSLVFLSRPDAHPDGVRFNDGKCDPAGRLWAGSMHLQGKKDAAHLYRFNFDLSADIMVSPVTISNGIVWSSDKKTMYYIDTPTRQIRAYDYHNDTGEISNERVAVTVPDSLGGPDGMAIDAEDKLWGAHWGGAAVIRWDPITGALLQKVRVPAPNTTSCAFGGEDLATLFITTASVGLANGADYPLSGGVFAVQPGVRGVPSALYAGPTLR